MSKHKVLRGLILVAIFGVVVSYSWWQGLPWLANHFGFALSGQGGLPFRIAYAGRTYANPKTCAYASWCQNSSSTHQQANPLCWKKEGIQQPLVKIGTIFTLFGSPYSLMAPQTVVSSKQTVFGIYVAYDATCYVPYTLEGGP